MRLGSCTAAHLTGNSNGSNQMKHECCRIQTVVLCEGGFPDEGEGENTISFPQEGH